MKVCIFGCKSTTQILARHLHPTLGVTALVTIDAQRAAQAQVADYTDLRPWCATHDVPVYTASRYDLKSDTDTAFFAENAFDVGFVVGWQRLVPAPILNSFSTGVFGMHGSAADLPFGRGRSPMNWALIEGRQAFYTNLFKYDPGVDSGDVLDTMAFSITPDDTAETLHFKNTLAMVHIIQRNRAAFASGALMCRKQPDLEPTFYPKRTPADSQIDWTAPIDVLTRFIRAVAPPFNGAFSFVGAAQVTITRAAVFEMDTVPYGFADRRPGEILEVFPNGKFLVKCAGGVLIVHEHTAPDDLALAPGQMFHNAGRTLKVFGRNQHGGHDLPETD